jgi:hypothetical protein
MQAMEEEAYLLATELVAYQPAVVKVDDLPGLIKASYERNFADVDRWLGRRLAQIKKHWKLVLQVPDCRPLDLKRLGEYREAAKLRETKQCSWAQLGLALEPEEFKRDPKRTAERIRKGVKGLNKQRIGRDNCLFYIPLFFQPSELADPAIERPGADWLCERLREAALAFFDLAEKHGYSPKAVLDEILTLYLLFAEKAKHVSGTVELLRKAQGLYLAELLSKSTPGEVERFLGEPQARIEEGQNLTYRYQTLTVEFKSGKFRRLQTRQWQVSELT